MDPAGWDQTVPLRRSPPYLDAVQRAVVDGEQLRLGYVDRTRSESERVVHPLGLAAKGASWYLVADTDAGLRTFRVDRVTSLHGTGEPVRRPEGFDLEEAWRLITDERLSVGLAELAEDWSLEDMLQAHQALDLRDELEAKAHEQAEKGRSRGGPA